MSLVNSFSIALRSSVSLNCTRNYGITKYKPKAWRKDGVKYGLITYYPRHPGHVDPPIEPTKLLMVHKVKHYKGNPHWDKKTLDEIGLKRVGRDPVIVKNTPEMCALLWNVKHLIKITPIELPENLPKETDPVDTYLHENGKLYVFPKVKAERERATEEFINNKKKFDGTTLQRMLRLNWLNGNV